FSARMSGVPGKVRQLPRWQATAESAGGCRRDPPRSAPRRRSGTGPEPKNSRRVTSLHEGVSRMSVSIKPLEDRVVVKPLEAEQTTASGLVIPGTAKEKPQEGEVIAVGAGRFDDKGDRVPMDVEVGDKVVFSKYGGTELKYGNDEFLVLGSRDILAVIND